MKKSLLLLCLTALGVGNVSAQGFTFGVRGSYTMANMSGLETNVAGGEKEGGTNGTGGGIFIKYAVNNKLSVSFDVLNNVRGGKYSTSDTLASGLRVSKNYRQDFRYFEMPLMINYHILGDSSNLNPYVGLGISGMAAHYTSLLTNTSSNGLLNGRDTSFSSELRTNNTTSYNKVDFSVVAGAGVSYCIQNKYYIGLDARYNFGLVDLRENPAVYLNSGTIEPKPVKNSAISIFLTLGMKLWDGK